MLTRTTFPGIPSQVIDGCNRVLDAASKDLGPNHRIVNHDFLSATQACAKVAEKFNRPAIEGAQAAMAHLLEDRISDGMVKIRVAPGISLKNIWDMYTQGWPTI